jgi:plastocyanin
MNQQVSSENPMTGEVRFRIPLPIVIPIGALLVIGGATFGLSRILLAVPSEVAVVVALAVAMNLLFASAFVANRPETIRSSWAELLIVFTYPIVVGVILTQLNLGEGSSTESGGKAAAGAGGLSISAQNVAFSTSSLTLPAGKEASLSFANDDPSSVQHNIGIYDKEGGKELFKGDPVSGGTDTTYQVPALDAGTYYFQCDFHPGMNGSVKVE